MHFLICFLSRVSYIYSEAKKLFTVQEDGEGLEINLHKVVEDVRKGRGVRWDAGAWQRKPVYQKKEGEVLEKSEVRLEKREVQEVRKVLILATTCCGNAW